MPTLAISPAEQAEYAAVLPILFQRAASDVRGDTIQQAVHLLSRGVLDPAGLLAARRAGQVVGVMLSAATPGAVGLVWPPQVAECSDREAVEDALIVASLTWLRQRQVKLAQALLSPAEADLGAALERNGFHHITSLLFLLGRLDDSPAPPPSPLSLQPYPATDASVFAATMRKTYEGTFDCPEVEGVRTIGEVLAGYRAQEGHDPARWWLVLSGEKPIGVLLANASTEEPAWEILYVGVAPQARNQGFGRHLIQHAMTQAKVAGMEVVKLAVDRRNVPALRLYKRLGFQIWDEREVFLAVLGNH
jgi:GNAT superfamily N-acetyltransferase